MKQLINTLGLLILLYSVNAMAATPLTYTISGVDDALRKNIELHLQTLPGVNTDKFEYFQNDILQAVRQAIEPMGYYSPALQLALNANKQGLVTIAVEVGQPVLLRKVSIQLEGEAKQDSRFTALLQDHPIPPPALPLTTSTMNR